MTNAYANKVILGWGKCYKYLLKKDGRRQQTNTNDIKFLQSDWVINFYMAFNKALNTKVRAIIM